MMEPVDYFQFIEELELIIVIHENTFHQSEVEKILMELETIPENVNNLKFLIDMRASDIKIEKEDIEKLGALIYESLGQKSIEKQAIIVGKLQMNKVVEFVKIYKHSSKYQVFDNFEGAFRWLKLPNDRKDSIKAKLHQK